MVSAATSNYHGQQGFAAGYSYVTESNRWVVKASVTGNTRSDFGAVVGAVTSSDVIRAVSIDWGAGQRS